MPTNYIISDWKKTLMLAVRALDTRLLADASNPLIAAGGCVTRFPGFSALPINSFKNVTLVGVVKSFKK
jgi:hypothetical protein